MPKWATLTVRMAHDSDKPIELSPEKSIELTEGITRLLASVLCEAPGDYLLVDTIHMIGAARSND